MHKSGELWGEIKRLQIYEELCGLVNYFCTSVNLSPLKLETDTGIARQSLGEKSTCCNVACKAMKCFLPLPFLLWVLARNSNCLIIFTGPLAWVWPLGIPYCWTLHKHIGCMHRRHPLACWLTFWSLQCGILTVAILDFWGQMWPYLDEGVKLWRSNGWIWLIDCSYCRR